MRRMILALVTALVCASIACADESESKRQFTAKSANGKFIAEFVSSSDNGDNGTGHVFLGGSSAGRTMYTLNWFSNSVFISNDGHYVVRLASWGVDLQPRWNFVIGFYRDGIELKSYSVQDILRQSGTIQGSACFASKTSDPTGFSADGRQFCIVTSEKQAYHFDVATGQILNVHLDPGAMMSWEIVKHEDEDAEKRARLCVQKSEKLSAFQSRFNFTWVSARNTCLGDQVLGYGDLWIGHLEPKDTRLSRTMAEVGFHIDDQSDCVEVGIDAAKLEQYLREIKNAAFIKSMLVADARNNFRMRAADHYYLWSLSQAGEVIKSLRVSHIAVPRVDNWVEVLVDYAKDGGRTNFVCFLHPVNTDIFVITSDPRYMDFSESELVQLETGRHSKYERLPVINGNGQLQNIISVPNPYLDDEE